MTITALVTFASPARADSTSWNPFLFTALCSTCGPQTPLTFEQVDGFQILTGGDLGPAIPLSPPDGNATPSGGEGNEGKPTLHLLPAAPGLGVSSFSTGGTQGAANAQGGDNDDQGEDNGRNDSGGENHAGGLDYGIDVNDGSNAGQNVVTFTSANGGGTDVSSNTPVGGGGGGQALVPEPTTLLLFGSGLTLIAGQLRKRRRAAR